MVEKPDFSILTFASTQQMIDKFQRIAQSIRVLQIPTLLVGTICLVLTAMIVMGGGSKDLERYLLPSVIGFVWAATTYAFIVTFRGIPAKPDRSQRLAGRLKRRMSRAWYWIIALVFLGSTGVAVILSSRLLSIWLSTTF